MWQFSKQVMRIAKIMTGIFIENAKSAAVTAGLLS
jgi:hypothetical protein